MAPPPARSHHAARAPRVIILALLLTLTILVAGCAELDQTAVPPGPLERVEDSPRSGIGKPQVRTPLATVLPPVIAVIPQSASRVYFAHGGDLWQLPPEGDPAPVVTGRDILAFGPSPDGEQVAVIFASQPEMNGNSTVAIMAADGSVALELPDPAPAESQAPVRAIAWSPTGSAVAVARQDGSLTLVDMSGTVRQLVPPQPGSSPDGLIWSPDGALLAYRDPALPGQPTSLYVVSVATGERHAVVTGDAGSAVLAAVWLPGRKALAYVRSAAGTIADGGDVFAVGPEGAPSDLLVSAGQFAPVAGATSLAAAPDGRTLAIAVYTPGAEHPLFHGLWLLDLTTLDLTEVPTPRGKAVTDLWWADHRLVVRAVDEPWLVRAGAYTGTEPFTLYDVDLTTLQVRTRYVHP
ncbi:MAG: hypothetical protein QJR03_02675 [Sphaerobacter sp.]|nr:hypothetical protein [Sphaerobacter sp.]